MSTEQLSKTTTSLPARITEALAAIGYQVVMPPIVESPGEDCAGLGYDPAAEGYQVCQTCQGWRTVRWRAVVAPVGELFPENLG